MLYKLVNEHNQRVLDAFSGSERVFRSATKIESIRGDDADSEGGMQEMMSPELTYNFAPTGVPPHNLILKIGVPVMVIRNVLHPHLCNGKMYVVKKFSRRVIVLSTHLEDHPDAQTFLLHRIDFQFDFADLKVTRRQFPVRLAFAATMHKGQGKTLDKLVID